MRLALKFLKGVGVGTAALFGIEFGVPYIEQFILWVTT